MPRSRSNASPPGRRSAARRPRRWSTAIYLLLILLLLGLWIRGSHRDWWDAGWTRVRTAAGLGRHAPAASGTTANAEVIPAGCGMERWRVKVLADPNAGMVNTATPVDTTLEHLVALPRPADIGENSRTPLELHAYRVQALLLRYKQETDQDLHLVLAAPDDERVTMVAEIPQGRCAMNDDRGALFDELREDLTLHFGPAGPTFLALPTAAHVLVTGVGFFDFLHGQSGMAPNGFELHPVLDLRVQ